MRRLLAACALAALVLAAPVGAAPPVVVSVSVEGGKPVVTWTLPAGETDLLVEVATAPDVAADGSFSGDVVDIQVFDDQSDTSTSWTGAAEDPGTYYVHVSTVDGEWSSVKSFTVAASSAPTTTTPSPAPTTSPPATTTAAPPPAPAPTPTPAPAPAATTPAPAVSGPAPSAPAATAPRAARVPNLPPRLAGVTLTRRGALVQATVRACDDRAGLLTLSVSARHGRAARTARTRLSAESSGCWPYFVRFRLPARSGRAVVRLRLRDAAGAWSRVVVRSLR